MSIQLNFINNSNDSDNSRVVIFQKNVATNFSETLIAWRIFNTGEHGTPHQVIYPEAALTASAFTPFEDAPPTVPVNKGDALNLTGTIAAHKLTHTGQAKIADEIHISNGLGNGAVNAGIYRGNKLLALRAGLQPGQTAAFKFEPVLWLTFLNDIEEGEVFTLKDEMPPVAIN